MTDLRAPVVTDADRQWAIEQRPEDWAKRAGALRWDDYVSDRIIAFERHYMDVRKPATEWSGMFRRAWWPKSDPTKSHGVKRAYVPGILIRSGSVEFKRALDVASPTERRVWKNVGVALLTPDDPRLPMIRKFSGVSA